MTELATTSLLAPRILRLFLDSWKMFAPMDKTF